MQLPLQNFSTVVNTMAATVQGACSSLIDLTVGSVLRAILEATASIALWLQYLLLQVLSMTRLATSIGADVDSWVQDFGLTRLPATFASGQVVFSSFNPTVQGATVPTGATIRSSDGSQSFVVVGGPYTRALGAASVTASVQAVAAGSAGNVQGGVVNVLGTALPGIDTVTNPNAFTGGEEAETDAALRLRFISYINTRSQATEQAFAFAIASVQQDLTYSIEENKTAAGVDLPGNVHVIVDDGSGNPPTALLASVAAALDSVRPVGTTVSIAAPKVLTVSISMTIVLTALSNADLVQSEVNTALTTYINGLGVGQALPYSRLSGLCYDADASVTNVQDVLLNGAVADVGGAAGSVVRAGPITLTSLLS